MDNKKYVQSAEGCGPSTETRNDRLIRVRNEVIPPPLLFQQDLQTDIKKVDSKQLITH